METEWVSAGPLSESQRMFQLVSVSKLNRVCAGRKQVIDPQSRFVCICHMGAIPLTHYVTLNFKASSSEVI